MSAGGSNGCTRLVPHSARRLGSGPWSIARAVSGARQWIREAGGMSRVGVGLRWSVAYRGWSVRVRATATAVSRPACVRLRATAIPLRRVHRHVLGGQVLVLVRVRVGTTAWTLDHPVARAGRTARPTDSSGLFRSLVRKPQNGPAGRHDFAHSAPADGSPTARAPSQRRQGVPGSSLPRGGLGRRFGSPSLAASQAWGDLVMP